MGTHDFSRWLAARVESDDWAAIEKCFNETAVARDLGLEVVLADPDRIRELLWNLLLNAAQAVGPGGRVELHGETRLNGVSPVVALRVEDSGRGIPEELRQRVFEPFETTKVSGTGLGLSLVRSIVLAHGGSIEITDSELGGACLSFWLPQASRRPSA